jgi:hypothetical protein
MRGEDGLVHFAGDGSIFVAEDAADDDVSIVKPQVGALVRLYFGTRFASVYPWPLCGKKGVCRGRHGESGLSIKVCLRVLYDDSPNKTISTGNHVLHLSYYSRHRYQTVPWCSHDPATESRVDALRTCHCHDPSLSFLAGTTLQRR